MEGLRHRPEGRPLRASMTDNRRTPSSQTPRDSQQDTPTHTVVVPNSIDMVSVLGPGDEHLRLIERAFDATPSWLSLMRISSRLMFLFGQYSEEKVQVHKGIGKVEKPCG